MWFVVSTSPARAASAAAVPNAELVELAAKFSSAYGRWLDNTASNDDLPYAQLRLLETIHCKGPQMMRAVSDELGLSARHVTALTDSLEEDQLLRRVKHPTDRRATVLELTDAGYELADRALAPRLHVLGELFDALSEAERRQLAPILTTLIEQLDARRQS
jgi:DNA-binding MarR family transcriptional regulator